MKFTLTAMVVAVVWVMAFEPVLAQTRGRSAGPSMRRNTRPTTSPYLNLLNRGNNNNSGGGVGFNYFQRVRPEIEFRQNDNRMQQSITNIQRQVNTQQQILDRQSNASQLTQSGHMTSFFSYGNFFPNRSGR
jgi:hypothetical protein